VNCTKSHEQQTNKRISLIDERRDKADLLTCVIPQVVLESPRSLPDRFTIKELRHFSGASVTQHQYYQANQQPPNLRNQHEVLPSRRPSLGHVRCPRQRRARSPT